MLIELLSLSNYGHYNIKLANILGLDTSVYLNSVMDIYEKANRKGKVTNNYFTVDRKYIQSITTFSTEKQRDIEDALVKIGIVSKEKGKPNSISINIVSLTNIMESPDEKLLKGISKLGKKSSEKVDKDESIRACLLNKIRTTDMDIRDAYDLWMSSVQTRNGWIDSANVIYGQRAIDDFCQGNKDVALKILEIASIHGYREIQWAINMYLKEYGGVRVEDPTKVAPNEPVKRLSTEVF